MAKSYSISDARSHLAELVSRAEEGKPVELTRRGQAVAAIISMNEYNALKGKKAQLSEMLQLFYSRWPAAENPLSKKDLENLRDRSKGRDFAW